MTHTPRWTAEELCAIRDGSAAFPTDNARLRALLQLACDGLCAIAQLQRASRWLQRANIIEHVLEREIARLRWARRCQQHSSRQARDRRVRELHPIIQDVARFAASYASEFPADPRSPQLAAAAQRLIERFPLVDHQEPPAVRA